MSKIFLALTLIFAIFLLSSIVGKILSGKKIWQIFIYLSLFFEIVFLTVYILVKTVIA